MDIIELTDHTFSELATGADQPVLVEFTARWCAPCKMLAPVLHDLRQRAGRPPPRRPNRRRRESGNDHSIRRDVDADTHPLRRRSRGDVARRGTGQGEPHAGDRGTPPVSHLDPTECGDESSRVLRDRSARGPPLRGRPRSRRLRPGGVLIEVEAISIEGGDTLNRAGGEMTSTPHIVGYQCAGTIREVGDGVTDRHVGQRVVATDPVGLARRADRRARGRHVAGARRRRHRRGRVRAGRVRHRRRLPLRVRPPASRARPC